LSSVLIYFEEKIDGASYGIPWILVTLVVEKTKFLLFSSKNLFLTYILSQTPRKHLETFLDQSMTSKTQKKKKKNPTSKLETQNQSETKNLL
jgi:hypothetical protein